MDEEGTGSHRLAISEYRPFWHPKRVAIIVLPALLFSAFAFQLWYHATQTSPVVDEPSHIFAGYRYLECRDYSMNPEHPPLVKLLAAASLISRQFSVPDLGCGEMVTGKVPGFVLGNMFLANNGVDGIVVPARLSASLISLIFAVIIFLAAREMFGYWTGVVALAIVAFEPNFIGNGSLVTTDMAISTTVFASVYLLYRYCKEPLIQRFLVVGIAIGLMVASKHSALLFLPILFALLVADAAIFDRSRHPLVGSIGRRTASFAAWLLIGFTILWAFYGFQYYSLPGATAPTISLEQYAEEYGRPETINSRSTRLIRSIGAMGVLPESYIVGLTDISAANSRDTVILNRPYSTGQWWYFPLMFLVKSSVPLLLLLPIGLVSLAFTPGKSRELMFLLTPAIVYFCICLTSGINIGIRHLLPVYPFFVVVAAAGSVLLCSRIRAFRHVVIAILLFHAITPFRIAPHYIAFSNDLVGGLNATHNYSRDANVDYGQSLKLPAEYVRQNNIDPNSCWFAGRGNYVLVKAMQPCRVLPSGFTRLVGEMMVDPVPQVIEGTIFVSTGELPPRGGPDYLPFAAAQPIALLGGTVFVYQGRFEIPIAAAMSHVNRAVAFSRSNLFADAETEAQSAIGIFSTDPRPHAALADIFFREERKVEARIEYEKAIRLAQSDPKTFLNLTVGIRKKLTRLDQN